MVRAKAAAMAKKRGAIEIPDDKSKTERVYRDLSRRIRELDLPPGLQLDKNRIADEYGVSRAPVSDAIARLATERPVGSGSQEAQVAGVR
jgi:DNA-binding GntR family transcriptional regulator